nr:Druantia anti-phage system protein DruA [Lamprocystis purpurea]
MDTLSPGAWVHCGRVFSAEEIAGIRQTVAWLPRLGRRELAATLCEHLQWYTETGTAKAHACREFLERLEAAGLVTLPPLQVARRPRPAPPVPVMDAPTPLHGPLAALGPVRLEPVRADAAAVAQWNAAVARWHPLGYKGAFGYRLRYFITAGEQRLGCLLLAGAARALAVRCPFGKPA